MFITHAREVREAQALASGNVADRRADAVRRRDEALSKLPKGETEASLTAAIEKEVKAKSTVWEASQHCSPENITLATTKAFCGHIEDLNKLVALAKEAREAREEIASIDKTSSSVSLASVGIIATKSSVEAGARALTNGLTRLGYHVTVVDTPLKGRDLSQKLRNLVLRYRETPGNRSYYYGVKWRVTPLPSVRPKGPRLAVDNTAEPIAVWG